MLLGMVLSVALATALIFQTVAVQAQDKSVTPASHGYAGSKSCMECHERFYQLWSTSRHGLAMQPYTGEFAKKSLTSQASDVTIGKLKYRADLAKGVVIEASPKGTKQYKMEHALGGKNVYYFLTPFPKGRLQTLPIAYDINKKPGSTRLPAASVTFP